MSDDLVKHRYADLVAGASSRIEALEAEVREAHLQSLASMGQAAAAYEAQLKAEAERDALAEKLEKAVDGLKSIAHDPYQYGQRIQAMKLQAKRTLAQITGGKAHDHSH